MSVDLLLKNALVVTEDATFKGGVAVANGQITRVFTGDQEIAAQKIVDLCGKVLLPGLVDGHVHFNEPGRTAWEGYRTGTKAAAAGGITTIVDMPLNATPPTINLNELEHKRAVVADQAVVDYAHWGGLVDNNLAELAAMHKAGVVGFKGFMSESGVDFARIDDEMLYAALQEAAQLDTLIAVHAENNAVTTQLGAQMQAAGRTERRAWTLSRPPATEVEAIGRALFWAEQAGSALHVVHVSTAAGVQAIVEARRRGVNVTAESCPHYLFFTDEDLVQLGPIAKCAPPLRCAAEVDALWKMVLAGHVDIIGSDHSPCTTDLKVRGNQNIWDAWGGISGIQSMLPAMLTAGVRNRGLSLSALAKIMCANPARRYGLYPQKGALLPGSDADFVVVDPEAKWTLTTEQLFYKNKHSPYVGETFYGQVQATYVRGALVYRQHEILAHPGFGKLLKRTPANGVIASSIKTAATNRIPKQA